LRRRRRRRRRWQWMFLLEIALRSCSEPWNNIYRWVISVPDEDVLGL
jgi:hypothetical protein